MQLHIKLQIRRALMCTTMLLMVQKSWEHQFRLVVYPIIYKALYIPVQVVIAGFLNHQHPSPFKPGNLWTQQGVDQLRRRPPDIFDPWSSIRVDLPIRDMVDFYWKIM